MQQKSIPANQQFGQDNLRVRPWPWTLEESWAKPSIQLSHLHSKSESDGKISGSCLVGQIGFRHLGVRPGVMLHRPGTTKGNETINRTEHVASCKNEAGAEKLLRSTSPQAGQLQPRKLGQDQSLLPT